MANSLTDAYKAFDAAHDDAAHLGTGFLRVLPDGSVERLDPRSVMLVDPDPIICECGMSGACMMDHCKWHDAVIARRESMEGQSDGRD